MSALRLPAMILCLVLAGCATPLDSGRVNALRRIGVVSVIGPQVQLQFTGTTVFGNRNKFEQAPDFQSDAVATAALVTSLRAKFPEVIALTPADRRLLPPTERKSGWPMGTPTQWSPESPETAAGIRQVAAARKLDAVVVAYPFTTTLSTIPAEGVGLAGENRFGIIKSFGVFASVAVAVFDGNTGKTIARGWKGAGGGNEGLVELPFRETLGEYSAAERAELRAAIQTVIRLKMEGAVKDTGLLR